MARVQGTSLTLSRPEARRFLLAHQQLLPPHQLRGKSGIREFVRHVGCIQFDPIDVVGRNPDLVLQSRVREYRPELLDQLLYSDRRLLDGWDKVASIYLTTDWPYFARHRARMRLQHGRDDNPPMRLADHLLSRIRDEGPLSSTDFSHDEMVEGAWGQPTRLVREAFDILYAMGELGVHHRIGTRRAFDLIERLVPAALLKRGDPNAGDQEYQDWHVLRRVRSVGLANPSATDYWYGITGVQAAERRAALARLSERGLVAQVQVDGIPGRTFYLASQDLPTLEAVRPGYTGRRRAAFIAPIDNLIWDRQMLKWLFDFHYTWEVYTPQAKRKYGYYVLPVLYGERFVARFDPSFDRTTGLLTIRDWWWEPGVRISRTLRSALGVCLRRFLRYLQAEGLRFGPALARKPDLHWLRALAAGPGESTG